MGNVFNGYNDVENKKELLSSVRRTSNVEKVLSEQHHDHHERRLREEKGLGKKYKG